MVNKEKHLHYLKLSLDLANLSITNGNHPFGALLVKDDKVLLTSENLVISLSDPTQHAELALIQKAYKELDHKVIDASTLYSSTEPCVMCAGAIYWSGIKKVVYGASNKSLSSIVGGSLEIPCRTIFEKGARKIETISFDDQKHFSNIHCNFWNNYQGRKQ